VGEVGVGSHDEHRRAPYPAAACRAAGTACQAAAQLRSVR
jgi:hypothetical protein